MDFKSFLLIERWHAISINFCNNLIPYSVSKGSLFHFLESPHIFHEMYSTYSKERLYLVGENSNIKESLMMIIPTNTLCTNCSLILGLIWYTVFDLITAPALMTAPPPWLFTIFSLITHLTIFFLTFYFIFTYYRPLDVLSALLVENKFT